jgi:hypothetical protein
MTPILLGRGWWHCPSEIKLYESRVQFSPIDSYHGWMTHVMGRQSHSWRWLDQVNVESTRTCDRLHAAEDSSVGWRLIFYNATWQPSMWGLYNNGFGPKVHWILFCAACCCGRRIANSSGHSATTRATPARASWRPNSTWWCHCTVGRAWSWLVALRKCAAFCGRRVANSTCIAVVASSASGSVM